MGDRTKEREDMKAEIYRLAMKDPIALNILGRGRELDDYDDEDLERTLDSLRQIAELDGRTWDEMPGVP